MMVVNSGFIQSFNLLNLLLYLSHTLYFLKTFCVRKDKMK